VETISLILAVVMALSRHQTISGWKIHQPGQVRRVNRHNGALPAVQDDVSDNDLGFDD
jgi:hypothetical protein